MLGGTVLILGTLLPLSWALLARLVRPAADDWRDAGALAAVLLGLGLVAFTEAASLLHALTPAAAAVAWALTCAALGACAWRRGRLPPEQELGWPARGEPRALIVASATLLAVVLAAGVAIAPNNSDSLFYHLPRVARWVQEGGVGHFPTWDARQLYSGPFAEVLILHTFLLTGGDLLANAVQGGALLLTAVAMSGVARRVGLSPAAQAWTAFLCVSMTGSLLEGQTNQNDLVVAALLSVSGAFGLDLARGRAGPLPLVGWSGALGLAVLTKGTTFLLGGLVALGPAVALAAQRRGRALLLAAAIALLPNLPHWSRNASTHGHPLVPPAHAHLFRVEDPGPRALGSNLLRMGATHLELPWPAARGWVEGAVVRAHEVVGVDPHDPATTFPEHEFRLVGWRAHDDLFSNTLYLLLALPALGLALLRRDPALRPLLAAVVLAGLTVAALLKWQPWLCRLTLPVVLATTPVTAAALVQRLTPRARALLAGLLLAHAAQVLGTYEGRRLLPHRYQPWLPALPREEHHHPVDWPLVEVLSELKGRDVRRLGLITVGNEYLVWSALRGRARIEHVTPWPDRASDSLRGAPDLASCDHVLTARSEGAARLRELGWVQVLGQAHVTVWCPPG